MVKEYQLEFIKTEVKQGLNTIKLLLCEYQGSMLNDWKKEYVKSASS